MRYCLFFVAVLMAYTVAAQQERKEFEGYIRYKHRFVFTDTDLDTAAIKSDLSTSSVLYIKDGNYKWELYSGKKLKVTEYFDDATQTVYFLHPGKDTLFTSSKKGYPDSLIAYNELLEIKTIANYKCKGVEAILTSFGDDEWETFRVMYYTDSIYLPPNRFHSYRTWAINMTHPKMLTWPLLIEIRSVKVPFDLIYEAEQVVYKKLSLSNMLKPAGLPEKSKVFQPKK